jgi:hypothetical protein
MAAQAISGALRFMDIDTLAFLLVAKRTFMGFNITRLIFAYHMTAAAGIVRVPHMQFVWLSRSVINHMTFETLAGAVHILI